MSWQVKNLAGLNNRLHTYGRREILELFLVKIVYVYETIVAALPRSRVEFIRFALAVDSHVLREPRKKIFND